MNASKLTNPKEPNTNPFTSVTKLSKIVALVLFILLPFVGFYLGVKYQKSSTVSPVDDINQRILTNPTVSPQSKYLVSLPLPSSPNLKITYIPFGEKWMENRMYIGISDSNIDKGLNMAWAGISIVVTSSRGENIDSFVKNHSEDYIRGLFQDTTIYYDPNEVTQTTRWNKEVYKYTKRDFQNSPEAESTLYILERGEEFILINVYINNESKKYNEIIDPILDSIKFE